MSKEERFYEPPKLVTPAPAQCRYVRYRRRYFGREDEGKFCLWAVGEEELYSRSVGYAWTGTIV